MEICKIGGQKLSLECQTMTTSSLWEVPPSWVRDSWPSTDPQPTSSFPTSHLPVSVLTRAATWLFSAEIWKLSATLFFSWPQLRVISYFCPLLPKYFWNLASVLVSEHVIFLPHPSQICSPPFSTFYFSKADAIDYITWVFLPPGLEIRRGCPVGGASRSVHTRRREVYILLVFFLCSFPTLVIPFCP